MDLIYRGYTITPESEGDHKGHKQHATHVNPLGRRNHASLAAAQSYIDCMYDQADIANARAQ